MTVQLLIGSLVGIIIVIPIISITEGESLLSVAKTIIGNKGMDLLVTIVTIVLSALAASIVQLIVHEGGHLVAGLLTGYKFVSFRMLNFTLIRKDGRLRWRNFELSGTGGQCLLAPPDKPIDEIDTRWYNAGGVLANILLSIVGIVLLIAVDMPQWLRLFCGIMVFIGFFFALTNGIPLKLGGVANDGYNLFQLEKDTDSKRCFCNVLENNVRNQEGEQVKDMPLHLFVCPEPVDWKNSLHVAVMLTATFRTMNLMQWEDAYQQLNEALLHKDDIIPLYMSEINCMMILTCIATGRDDEARQYYDQKTKDYVNRHAPTQSDKCLVKFAVTLALDNDRTAAVKIYDELKEKRDEFIHQGDVSMSLEVMQWLLDYRSESVPSE